MDCSCQPPTYTPCVVFIRLVSAISDFVAQRADPWRSSVFFESALVRARFRRKKSARGESAANNNARADKQRKLDSNVPRASLRPHPCKPFIRCVKVEGADTEQGGAERRLVFEAPGNKLSG